MPRLMVCGGGTGGHFFSGLAVAEKFLKIYPDGDVIFVGTAQGIEGRFELQDPRMTKSLMMIRGFKGKSLLYRIRAFAVLIQSLFRAAWVVWAAKPQIVFGVGGYASFPTVLVALIFKLIRRHRVCVLDQNSSVGLANRILSRFGAESFCAFEVPGFQLVDLPLRQSFVERASGMRPASWPPQVVFILGGSQGATGLNQRWCKLLPEFAQEFSHLRIIHQTGAGDLEMVKKAYAHCSLQAEVFDFRSDLAEDFHRADALICRAGAMTVFEVLALKRPALFVPFPKATEDHQRKNALSVQAAEWVISEAELAMPKLRAFLGSVQAPLPYRRLDSARSWDEILRCGGRVVWGEGRVT